VTERGRCLFVMGDMPICPNAPGGGSALRYGHLDMLVRTGFEITLVVLTEGSGQGQFAQFVQRDPNTWKAVQQRCESCHTIPFRLATRQSAPLRYLLGALRDPLSYYAAEDVGTRAAFQTLVSKTGPDVIWAAHYKPVLLALRAAGDRPVVFAHSDWASRIGKLRGPATGSKLRLGLKSWLWRRAERALMRKVTGCVSVSATEAAEVRDLGLRHVAYVPPTYDSVPAPFDDPPSDSVRIVHVGGMRTTASRLGLQRLLDVVWPTLLHLLGKPPELWVVGDLDGASAELLARLKRAGAVCTGFVPDLRSVLRPYDLHVIPWEHNTGTRTRIPVALNHGQVLVSTRAAAACLPEVRSEANCVLVDDLQSMSYAIARLLCDKLRRAELARAGRATFLAHFTREAVQPRFDEFMDQFMRGVQRGRALLAEEAIRRRPLGVGSAHE